VQLGWREQFIETVGEAALKRPNIITLETCSLIRKVENILLIQFRYCKTSDFILGQYLLILFLRICIMCSSCVAS
jgi:hypothetical protein